jgi:glyoxylase-like metal-dependent hydrolase (beta-lactamase superfamily II)
VIAAPGHTEESVVFYNEASGELIAGDLILGKKDGRGYLNRFCWDEGQSQRTFAALAQSIRVRIIFPGHGPVIWSAEDAFRKVDCFGDALVKKEVCNGYSAKTGTGPALDRDPRHEAGRHVRHAPGRRFRGR